MSTSTRDRLAPLPSAPPEAWEPLLRIARLATRPLDRFLRIEASSGILLLLAAALALGWANSPWEGSYHRLWHTPLAVRVGSLAFERTLEWFVNDVLMVIFFFVAGLEIRRELHHGELSEWRRAALPALAALGGMLAPALIYLLVAGAPATRSGWGVPTATDIAFAVGVLALLGARVPAALRVLLLALAVIDDLGAIVVIALFYSAGVEVSGLVVAALGLVGILATQRFGVRSRAAYVAPAAVIWLGMQIAGIHPTIAGVIVGLATPVRAWLGREGLVVGVRARLDELAREADGPRSSRHWVETLRHVRMAGREAVSPVESAIDALHPWVAFGIMPIFALANAGVTLSGLELGSEHAGMALGRVTAGVALGLVLGKPIGVLLSIGATVRLGVGALPVGIGPRHLVVLGVVAGVGFTMALFVAQLAFADARLLAAAKLGIVLASGTAAVVGLTLGRVLLPRAAARAAQTADEAESSTEL